MLFRALYSQALKIMKMENPQSLWTFWLISLPSPLNACWTLSNYRKSTEYGAPLPIFFPCKTSLFLLLSQGCSLSIKFLNCLVKWLLEIWGVYVNWHLLTNLLADVSEELQKLHEVGHPFIEALLKPHWFLPDISSLFVFPVSPLLRCPVYSILQVVICICPIPAIWYLKLFPAPLQAFNSPDCPLCSPLQN